MNILNKIRKIPGSIKNSSLLSKIVSLIVLVVVVLVGIHIHNRPASVETPEVSDVAHVQVSSVSNLSNQDGGLSLTGKVTSISKASILAVNSGEIVRLNRALGDHVGAGEVIASLESSSQRAAVAQAQGAYDGAMAAQHSVSPVDAKAPVVNQYKKTYDALDIVLHSQVDLFFANPGQYNSPYSISTYPYPYNTFPEERDVLRDKMIAYQKSLVGADSADPNLLIKNMSDIVEETSVFLNQMSVSANNTNSGASDAQLSALTAARSTVSGLASSVAGVQQTYRAQSVTSSASVDASVATALGGLQAAQANLEKTNIRAPISGTIVSLPLTLGGYVTAFSEVAQISNPNALEVDVYITSDDAKTISIGNKVTIDNSASGTVAFIAPALDPTTGKILVKISTSNDMNQEKLTDGDTVSVSVARISANSANSATGKPTGKAGSSSNTLITIPITASKITPTGPVVFTVNEGVLVSNPVVFGAILGDRVTVQSGLTPDMMIVTDARGLTDGQKVLIDPLK